MKVNKEGFFMIRNDVLSNLIVDVIDIDNLDTNYEKWYDSAEIFYRQGLYLRAEVSA